VKLTTNIWCGALGFSTSCAFVFGIALGQSQLKTSAPDPEHETIELENENVRVVRVKIPPHGKSIMHPHPKRVVIPLSVQRSRSVTSEGKVTERSRVPGQVSWAEANTHMTQNLSDMPIETLMVEIKDR
jgi:hypothetical protein